MLMRAHGVVFLLFLGGRTSQHIGNIIQVIFVYVTIKEKEAINLTERKQDGWEGLAGEKGRQEML